MKLFLSLCMCCIFLQHLKAQTDSNPNVVRTTTGVSGASIKLDHKGKTYIVQQSIGQSSVIGVGSDGDYILRQGFIQPNIISKIKDKDVPLSLQLDIYPNPFEKQISLSFREDVKDHINVTVYDLLGRQVFSKRYTPGQLINVVLDELSSGEYILKAGTNNKQFITKILKK